MFIFLFFVFWFSGAAGAAELPFPAALPSPQAFLGWQEYSRGTSSPLDLSSLESKPLECAKELRPTHPQQNLKLYHRVFKGNYDHHRLRAEDEACLLGGKFKNGYGLLPCLRAHEPLYYLISDTYEDGCGNFYRAFSEVVVFKQYENMGSLFSPGRTMYPDPNAPLPGMMVVGETYTVQAERFILLTPLFPGDRESLQKARLSL